jgi:predicted kinase
MKTDFRSFLKNERPLLFVPIGISGSGKSTYFQQSFVKDFPWVEKIIFDNGFELEDIIVCPDNIRREVLGNVNDQRQGSRIFELARERLTDILSIVGIGIFDSINVSKYRNQFLNKFPTCDKIALVFKPDVELSYERIRNQILKGEDRSAVSLDVLKKQIINFTKTVVGDPQWDGTWNEKTKQKIEKRLGSHFQQIIFID